MGADISQFKQAGLVKHIPDLAKIEEHGNGEGKGKFSNQSFPHFSDYSMFPDRFNGKSSPKAILGHSPPNEGSGSPHPHFSDYTFYPDKFDRSQKIIRNQIDQHQSLPTPSGLISRYNFRIRRSSESDDVDPSEIHDLIPDQKSHRARSLSTSKMYYFDFSLLPDKDPHYTQDELSMKQKQIGSPQSPSIIIEETSGEEPCRNQKPEPAEPIIGEKRKMKRVRTNSEPRYGFFDFSMIPDKDPRFFSRSNPSTSSPDEKPTPAKI